jgi:hypothetical protein
VAHPLERGWTRATENARWDASTEAIRNAVPYSFGEAKRAHARASREQAEAAQFRVRAGREFAAAEKAYRVGVRKRMVALAASGVAWTVCKDLAVGEEEVATLKFKRDVAHAVFEAARDVSLQRNADRRVVDQMTDWSMRVAPDGQYGQGRGA